MSRNSLLPTLKDLEADPKMAAELDAKEAVSRMKAERMAAQAVGRKFSIRDGKSVFSGEVSRCEVNKVTRSVRYGFPASVLVFVDVTWNVWLKAGTLGIVRGPFNMSKIPQ